MKPNGRRGRGLPKSSTALPPPFQPRVRDGGRLPPPLLQRGLCRRVRRGPGNERRCPPQAGGGGLDAAGGATAALADVLKIVVGGGGGPMDGDSPPSAAVTPPCQRR
ncbi:hypothetical protein I4F81_005490 [Pyropia yezoensis]|uniref:Uncharacterized protein n=1 Tax=Pyropia yezoensis TaxID=2788 RepID=A0ACC3BY28_PYRYE|nr:hypothetical protein I4F81_005490 [Neopyropia yezoensis]